MADDAPRDTMDWAGERARRWSSVADRLEAQIAPVSDVLFGAAALAPGETVLDVGCGRGVTTRRAAEAVGPDGRVTGLDISAGLLDEARAVPGAGPLEWVVGDAQVHPLPEGSYDAVISRFGVMFFADPAVAFANLARATTVGGRLCVAVWQRRDCSALMQRPLDAAVRVADSLGVTLTLPDPADGPFTLGDPDEVVPLLTSAGWTDVGFAPHTLAMYAGGPGSVDDAVTTSLTLGPLHDALADAPDELVAAVRRGMTTELAPLHDGTGVVLDGAVAILTARKDRP